MAVSEVVKERVQIPLTAESISAERIAYLEGLVNQARTAAAVFTQFTQEDVDRIVKAMVLPWVLHGVVQRMNVRREVEPVIPVGATLALTVVIVVVSFQLSASLGKRKRSRATDPAAGARDDRDLAVDAHRTIVPVQPPSRPRLGPPDREHPARDRRCRCLRLEADRKGCC